MIDTHCHLAARQFSEEFLQDLLEQAVSGGLQQVISVATGAHNWQQNLQLAAKYPALVKVALGWHPCDVEHADEAGWVQLEQLLQRPEVVAVGESGLDYFHDAPEGWDLQDYRSLQQQALQRSCALALQCDKPIIIHTRDRKGRASFDDALAILQQCAVKKAVFHCFIGDVEQLKQLRACGYMVSFTGIASFKNAGVLKESIRAVDEQGYMLETDAPYLAPEPMRGKLNHPGYLPYTAAAIAALRAQSLQQVQDSTNANARRFFAL